MLQFKSGLTEDQIMGMGLLAPGIYNFKVIKSVSGYSKSSGSPMITLTLEIVGKDGFATSIVDYLLSTNKSMLYKLRHACDSLGILDKFELGAINADDFLGREGQASIIIKKGEQKDNGGFFDDSNRVEDYIKRSDHVEIKQEPKFEDDEIPF